MAIKQYLKNVIGAVLPPVAKSLWGVNPAWSVGVSMLNNRVFSWDTSGYNAYGNKIFYTGARLIVRKMTEAPLTFNKKKANPKKSIDKLYSKTILNPERNTIKEQNLEELPDHELTKMIDGDTMEDFWHRYNFGAGVLYFETLGDEYSRNTKPIKAWSLDPRRIIKIQSNGRFDNISHYMYTCLNGEQIRIEKSQVVYLKHWNPNITALTDYGVDIPTSIDIALNQAGNETEGAAFVNGGRGTLFSSKAEIIEGEAVYKMSNEQISSLKETMERDMQGAKNNRRMRFTNGEVVVTPYGDTLAEMEVSKSEEIRWMNIFAIMGIPWALTPVASKSSENSVIQGYKALVTNLVISELRRFDTLLTKTIQQWWPEIVAVSDLTEYTELAPDLKLMKEVYGTPAISEDERRKIFGFDELGGKEGKAILVPSGMMLLTDVINSEFDETPNSDVL